MTKPTNLRRQAVRAAVRIHEHLAGKARNVYLDSLPEELWKEVCEAIDRLRIAQRRGWSTASQMIRSDLSYTVGRLAQELTLFQAQLPQRSEPTAIATPGEILADLEGLAEEFEEVEIDLRDGAIQVRTEPIVLEDIHLGSFKIVLVWETIGLRRAYKIVAEESHRPNGHGDVTHPHVRDEVLCEGDGAASIKAALTSGRLLDFFVLVRQILRTYNPGSPHVQLDDWHGIACRDCGYRMDSEDHSICDRCDEPLCSDCSCSCQGCDRWICGSCQSDCSECGRTFCDGCLSTPAGTSRQLCESCREKGQATDEEEIDETATANTVCLGEAAAAA